MFRWEFFTKSSLNIYCLYPSCKIEYKSNLEIKQIFLSNICTHFIQFHISIKTSRIINVLTLFILHSNIHIPLIPPIRYLWMPTSAKKKNKHSSSQNFSTVVCALGLKYKFFSVDSDVNKPYRARFPLSHSTWPYVIIKTFA